MMIVSLAERYGAGQHRGRDLVLLLLDEALPKGLVGANPVCTTSQSLLKFRYGLVHEAHFLVRDSQVVVALVVLIVDVFGDTLLEALEHLLKVSLLVTRRWLLFSH